MRLNVSKKHLHFPNRFISRSESEVGECCQRNGFNTYVA